MRLLGCRFVFLGYERNILLRITLLLAPENLGYNFGIVVPFLFLKTVKNLSLYSPSTTLSGFKTFTLTSRQSSSNKTTSLTSGVFGFWLVWRAADFTTFFVMKLDRSFGFRFSFSTSSTLKTTGLFCWLPSLLAGIPEVGGRVLRSNLEPTRSTFYSHSS